jgi:starch synthase
MGFLTAVVRALETYKNKEVWKKIVKRAMEQDFSWDKAAGKYIDLYKRALESHCGKLK